jgi:hypothetical protein
MATEIPASITMPDTVETRLGTLTFFDGFPDDASVDKVFDNLDFQRAVQAYLQGLPAVTLLGMRTGLRQWGPVNQTVAIAENMLDSHTLLLGGNANTVSAYYYPNSAWRMLYHGGYRLEQEGARLWDSYISVFFYGWGLSPAMEGKIVGKGSQYALAYVDAHGEPFDGSKSYRLHLPPHIPVVDFWSVTLYDTQTRSMLQTDQPVPIVSSQTPRLAVNADTSVDIYFGPEPPAGKEHNWVQTISGKGWWIGLRLYGPLEPWFDQTWRPGEIERVP